MPLLPRAALNERNIRQVSAAPGNDEREQALLEKMQTLSALLGKVDAALGAETSSERGSVTASVAPSCTSRPTTQQSHKSTNQMRPATQQRAQAPATQPTEQEQQEGTTPKETSAPVQYIGTQSHTAGIQRLRKIDARAMRSSVGLLLSEPRDGSKQVDAGRPAGESKLETKKPSTTLFPWEEAMP